MNIPSVSRDFVAVVVVVVVVQEVQHVCKCAVERNAYQMSVSARRQSFEAWRQLVEMLLTGCPADLLTGELRQNVIFELLQDLLDKARILLSTLTISTTTVVVWK